MVWPRNLNVFPNFVLEVFPLRWLQKSKNDSEHPALLRYYSQFRRTEFLVFCPLHMYIGLLATVIHEDIWELIVNGCSEPPVQLFSLLFFRLTILSITMGVTATDYGDTCFIARVSLWSFDLGYVVSLAVGLILETVLFWVSLRGTILETAPRVSVQYILYIRLGKVHTKVKSNSFKMSKLIT